jgi:ERCC4-type nuclease
MWIDMLMAVPSISEKKALAIFEHYQSLTKLMDAYEDQIDEESKTKMMTNIQVSKKFDSSSKARNLGKALSGRFYAVFQS